MKYVYDYLDSLNIKYEIVKHPAAQTTELADKYIEGYEGVRTKSMFLYNKKKTAFYLVILEENKRINFELLENTFSEKKLKFSSDETLINKLNLPAGTVSIFGLLNNNDKDITVVIDKSIKGDLPLTFHPNINTATIFVSLNDTIKFMDSLDVSYKIMEL